MNSNIRQMIRCLIVAVTFSLLGGCDVPTTPIGPGHADFSAKLVGDYFVHRTSANQIMIAPQVWNDSTPTVPTIVIECAIDRHLVLAKRQGLKRRSSNDPTDHTYGEPDASVFDYWILDTSAPKVFGPMTRPEFDTKRSELGVPDAVALRDVYSFRP
jgi:hypothetical protein